MGSRSGGTGCHHFPGLEPPEPLWQSGFLEWLGDTPACPTPQPTSAWPSDAWLDTLGERVYVPSGKHRGALFILPAVGTHANLGRRYAAVDWNTLFIAHPEYGLHLLRRARDALVARFDPSFLLIDARTGVSDLGGLLTGFLPDCTVLVGNYGAQSTEGLRSVYLALDRFATERAQSEAQRHSRLDRLLVASPVPVSPTLRERGRARWSSGFPGVAPRTAVEVPLVEDLLYAEDILVHTAPSSDAARAYRDVADQLIELRASQARTQRADQAQVYEAAQLGNIALLLQRIGLDVTMTETSDLIARERSPLGDRIYHVGYVEGWAGPTSAMQNMIERLRGRLRAPNEQLLLIVDAAGEDGRSAAEATGVTLRTTGELMEQVVDLHGYIATIRREFEGSELARTYVPPRLVVDGRSEDALDRAVSWATGQGQQLFLLAGPPGSGKTSLLRRLAYELASRAELDRTFPIPVLIDLHDVGPHATIASLLQQHLSAALGWYGNPDAILHLYESGRIILLWDGLDEFPAAPGELAYRRLQWLAWSTTRPGRTIAGNRMLLTTQLDVLTSARSPEGPDFGDLAPRIATMAPFDMSQISMFLHQRLAAAQVDAALVQLISTPALARLAALPMQLRLLADLGSKVDRLDEITNATTLYGRYVAYWLDRHPPSSGLDSEMRWVVLERLAAELWQRRGNQLPLPSLAAELFVKAGLVSASQLDEELRMLPFVSRSTSAEYRFVHDALLEYFFARHLARCFRAGDERMREALATEPISPSCASLFAELVVDRPDAHASIHRIAVGPYTAGVSENALRLAAALPTRDTARPSSGPMETPGF